MRRVLSHGAALATCCAVLALAQAGCAVAAKSAEAPATAAPSGEGSADAAQPAPEPAPMARVQEVQSAPADTDDPAEDLARAELDLDRALAARTFAAPPPEKKAEIPARSEGASAEGDGCVTACKALASMRRSADRLCDIDATTGAPGRCEDARGKVERAERRVRERCGGACGG